MIDQNIVKKTLEALKKNRMEAVYIPTREELLSVLDTHLEEQDSVSFGGSMTLFESGVMDHIKELASKQVITLLDRNKPGLTPEDVAKLYRDSFFCDAYLTSSNAITQDGCLYNVDGNGNRVAAMLFGPKKVIVIAGTNKIVQDHAAAERRLEEIAAPLNAKRLKLLTPCAKTGTCMHCQTDARICCDFVTMGWQRIPGRVRVLLVGESLGY